MIAQEAQKRVKTAAKRSRAAPPKGVIDMKTGMERKAIRAARRALYDGLIGLGIEGAFDACSRWRRYRHQSERPRIGNSRVS